MSLICPEGECISAGCRPRKISLICRVFSRKQRNMTSKQRAYLKSLASKEDTILQVGKEGLTPECTASIAEALAARELVKVGILQNYDGDLNDLARTAAERTRSSLVQVIGRKFVLYKEGKDEKKKIVLPGSGKKD